MMKYGAIKKQRDKEGAIRKAYSHYAAIIAPCDIAPSDIAPFGTALSVIAPL
jgi:hypothetical protein